MNKQEILTKAIEKAKKGGFDNEAHIQKMYERGNELTISYEALIFSHDFLKAFFGEDESITSTRKDVQHGDILKEEELIRQPNWQYHAQQMVISEDPLMYLEAYV